MNICRKFVFREILNEVRPVELRGEAIPALFFLKSCWWVSQKWKLPVTFRTRFLPCVFVIFLFFEKSEKVRPRESQGLSNAALKNGLLK